MYIHDLHLEYCRRSADRGGDRKEWHRRWLNGHIALNETDSSHDVDSPLGLNMLEYVPRQWWKDDVQNKSYVLKHLSRHLRSGGLDLELGATMLDLRWIRAQGRIGGVLDLRNDFNILERVVEQRFAAPAGPSVPRVSALVRLIADSIETMSSFLHEGSRVLSFTLFADLFLVSKTNWMRQFLERMKEVVPKPFLEETVSFYRPPGDDLKFHLDFRSPGTNEPYLTVDFSTCERYTAAGSSHDIVVFNVETMHRLKLLKGHTKEIAIVKFSSDSSRLFSGSMDNNVIIWDWNNSESPHFTLRGHKAVVTALAASADDSRLFPASLDGTVKMWDMIAGRLCGDFVCGVEVESVAASPSSEMVAVGTRDGHLRCIDWISGQPVFEDNMLDNSSISSMQFGTDGKVLVSGNYLGSATAWFTSDRNEAATGHVPGAITGISFHPDGANVILGSSQGEVRHWPVAEKELARYKLSVGRPVNGISFRKNENDIIVGIKLGYARAWSGPQSNPTLDFE